MNSIFNFKLLQNEIIRHILGMYCLGWFDGKRKLFLIEEIEEWNQADSMIECGESTFYERTEKPSSRVGTVIPINLRAARLDDKEMTHFSPQKSAKINLDRYYLQTEVWPVHPETSNT